MKIIEGIKQEWKPFEIPDCTRDDLPEFFKEMGYRVGVEIGIQRGYYTKSLCEAGLKVYGIDPWLRYDDNLLSLKQYLHDKNYEESKATLAPYDCKLIRKTSMGAIKDFENESLDFVYIDGNHSFKYLTEDIFEWSKKVRKGGVISGHDYINRGPAGYCDVKWVIDAYTMAMKLPKWFILGRKKALSGERADECRSWFWIK